MQKAHLHSTFHSQGIPSTEKKHQCQGSVREVATYSNSSPQPHPHRHWNLRNGEAVTGPKQYDWEEWNNTASIFGKICYNSIFNVQHSRNENKAAWIPFQPQLHPGSKPPRQQRPQHRPKAEIPPAQGFGLAEGWHNFPHRLLTCGSGCGGSSSTQA